MGRPMPWAIGMAPLSSISGTMDTKNGIRYCFIGNFL